jgi:hypothetical protein
VSDEDHKEIDIKERKKNKLIGNFFDLLREMVAKDISEYHQEGFFSVENDKRLSVNYNFSVKLGLEKGIEKKFES